jgi:glucokinase
VHLLVIKVSTYAYPVVGIDLGATKVAMGLVDDAGNIIASERFPTEATRGPEFTLNRIAAAIKAFNETCDGTIAAVGVCSPGPVDHVAGLILDPPNLGWRNVPFRQMLTQRLQLPVTLEHDAKAAALGEYHFGAGTGSTGDLVYVIVGTGVGAAIILNGQLYRGHTNSAGELGHITLHRTGEPGSSGVPGCVESYMSGPSLVKQYIKLADQAIGADMALTGQDIVQRAHAGDQHAIAVMNDAGDALGAAVATTAMLMDMSFFVIGGSVAKAGDLLIEPARKAVWKYAFASVAKRIEIVATQLHENGAVLGCAWQAREKLRM